MTLAARRRGEPLMLLVAVLTLWTGARLMFRVLPFSPSVIGGPALPAEADVATGPQTQVWAPPVFEERGDARQRVFARLVVPAEGRGHGVGAVTSPAGVEVAAIGSSWAKATLPSASPPTAPPPFQSTVQPMSMPEKRWSTDAWVLIRDGGRSGLGAGLAPATYGASQAGAVLRYRLAPGDAHQPTAYVRASRSLDGPAQQEAAAGLSLRPVAAVPIVAAGELRLFHDASGTRTHPVLMAVTEVRPLSLPQGFRAETYVQAGYVGGKRATGFIDGQARLDRRMPAVSGTEMRLGAGAWGGAQRGAARLDLGPSATLSMPLSGRVFARAAIDWRFRVAGNATPASGPAFTLSAGF